MKSPYGGEIRHRRVKFTLRVSEIFAIKAKVMVKMLTHFIDYIKTHF